MGRAVIPPILHRVWLDDPMPEEFERYGHLWAELHPEWEVRDWRSTAELPELRCRELFARAPDLVPDDHKRLRSDIVRLELLFRYGGVYADCDFEPVRPLDELRSERAWAAWEVQDRWVCQAIMGAEPAHPFFRRLLDGLPENVRRNLGSQTSALSGPRYVTSVYRDHPDELTVLDQKLFYPYRFDELQRAGERFPGAFAIHRWNNRRSGRDSHGRRLGRLLRVRGIRRIAERIRR